jgi:hypothetical protein
MVALAHEERARRSPSGQPSLSAAGAREAEARDVGPRLWPSPPRFGSETRDICKLN